MPEVDPARKASVLVAVAAERERARERRKRIVRAWQLGGAVAFLAAAGLVAAVWLRPPGRDATVATNAPAVPVPAVGRVDSAAAGARLAGDARLAGYKSVQVVLRAPAARRVSVVGDFNAWDTGADAMSRD